MINKDIILKLSNEIGTCSAGIASVLQDNYKLVGLDSAMLENYGFILAYLHEKGVLSTTETYHCITFFVGANLGHHIQFSIYIAEAFRFYKKHLSEILKKPDDIRTTSIIVYNLCRPGRRDGFNKDEHIGEIDALETLCLWDEIDSILHNQLPNRLNPLLKQL